MDQDATWYGGRTRPRPHCVRWGPSSPSPKRGRASSPIFGPCLFWPNGWMDQDGNWHGQATLCYIWNQLPSPKNGQSPLIFGPSLLWQNGWMHQDATWYGGRLQPMRLCVRWGPSRPPQKWGGAPQFPAHVYCGQTAGWMKLPLGTDVCHGPNDIVLHGDSAPPRRAQPPIFGHVYCGQTAVCIMMGLGTEVGLCLGDIVLDGDPALLPYRDTVPPTNF